MKVICRHGHFAFYPTDKDELVRLQRLLKTVLFSVDDYYTFPTLAALNNWSLAGLPFGNLPALTTFCGRDPWDVMKANGFVFSLATMTLVPVASIMMKAPIHYTLDCAVSTRVIFQPGGLDPINRLPIVGYEGEIDIDFQRLYIYSREFPTSSANPSLGAAAIPASCAASVVTALGVPVPVAQILGEGVGQSSGALVLNGLTAFYVPNTQPDLKTTLEQVVAALQKVSKALDDIGQNMAGDATITPPDLVTDLFELNAKISALDTLKGGLI